jgi:hypothetical protein
MFNSGRTDIADETALANRDPQKTPTMLNELTH